MYLLLQRIVSIEILFSGRKLYIIIKFGTQPVFYNNFVYRPIELISWNCQTYVLSIKFDIKQIFTCWCITIPVKLACVHAFMINCVAYIFVNMCADACSFHHKRAVFWLFVGIVTLVSFNVKCSSTFSTMWLYMLFTTAVHHSKIVDVQKL